MSRSQEVFEILTISWATKKIVVGGNRLRVFHFADDIVLIASIQDLQGTFEKLSTAYLEVRLEMNRSKTQIMSNSMKRRVVVDVRWK